MASEYREALVLERFPLPDGWEWKWLDQIMDIRGGAQPPASTFKDCPAPGYVRFIQIRDFDGDSHITYIEDSTKWRKCDVGDVLIARYGASLGRILRGLSGAYNVALVKILPTHANLAFLYYLLKSDHFQAPLAGLGARSVQAGFNKNDLSTIPIPVPPLNEQRAIASVLGSLDDKIELNRRMNRTLEQMAAAIFKAWFVDFEPVKAKAAGAARFPTMPQPVFDALPTEFTDSPLGPIPKGWETRAIADLARYVNGKAFTKHATGTGRMIIRIAELNSGPGGSTKYSDIETDADFTAYPDDILFSWSGSLGIYRWHRPEAIINQHIFKVLPDGLPKWFVYHALLEALPYFRTVAAGKATTMGHIQRHHLSDVEIAMPPKSVLDGASSIEPLFRKVHVNEQESQTLAKIRDALLPKLLSGEIRVGGAKKLVEEVA